MNKQYKKHTDESFFFHLFYEHTICRYFPKKLLKITDFKSYPKNSLFQLLYYEKTLK